MLETKDENLLKMFVIALHIANLLFVIVEFFNSSDFFSFTINSFMFFSATSIGVYSLEPKTKKVKSNRLHALLLSFWSAVSCIFLMILSLIQIEIITTILLVILKLYTVIAGGYCTILLIKIDSEISNNDKRYVKNLKEIMNDSIMKKTPNEIKSKEKLKSKTFIIKNSRKGKRND